MTTKVDVKHLISQIKDTRNCSPLDLFKQDGFEKLEQEEQAYIYNYLRQFLVPTEGGDGFIMGAPCNVCGKSLGGFVGTFKYFVIHGEGYCSNCQWPVRTHHYIKDGNGNDIVTIRGFGLMYHPSVIEVADGSTT